MKNLLKVSLLMMLLLSASFLVAQDEGMAEGEAYEGVAFFEGSWEEAVQQAKAEGKFLMIDAYTDWCYWCKVMDKNTFADAGVGDFYRNNIVAYKMDMEKGRGIKMAMKYRVSSFPTFLFFSPEGPLVARIMGYQPPEPWLNSIKEEVLNKDKHFKHPGDPKNLDVKFPDFYKDSFKKGKERKMPEEETVLAFLDKQDDLMGEIGWSVMSRFGFPGKYKEYFLGRLDSYRGAYGAEVDRQVDRMIYMKVMEAAKEKDEDLLNEALKMVNTYSKAENPEMMEFSYKMMYAERTENWEMFGEMAEAIMNSGEELPNGRINSLCWDIYLHVEDKALIKQAVKWMEPVVESEPDYAYLDTYAALLYKAGSLEKAKEYAEEAIRVGKEAGENVKDTEELLEKIMND
jgi:thioredoxin-related protein